MTVLSMTMIVAVLALLVPPAAAASAAAGSAQQRKRVLGWTPTQIHLAWTNDPSEMAVTWVRWQSSPALRPAPLARTSGRGR